MKVEADDKRNLERRAGLKAERRIALYELHSSLKNDENSFWNEKVREVEEGGRKVESHEMFVAVKFLKGTSVR